MRTNRQLPIKSLLVMFLIAGVSLLFTTCKYPSEPVKGNTIPETRLSNVPANDTIALYINLNTFPELTVSWIGDDPDGYIIGYRFRWTDFVRGRQVNQTPWTTILNLTKTGWQNVIAVRGTPGSMFKIYDFLATLGPTDTSLIRIIGDSLFTKRPFVVPYKTGAVATDSIVGLDRQILQTPTTGTFIFYSPVDSNLHRFEVSSIDNMDAVDPTPSVVNFWTLVSPGSVVLIDQVPPANSLCIRYPTDRFPGLRFVFRSLDPNNTNDLTFSWSVDDTVSWSDWSSDTFADVTAIKFKPVVSGTHRFNVRARNRWGVISSTVGANFSAIIPDFDSPGYQQRILVLSATRHTDLDTNRAKSFYSEVLDSIGKSGKYDFFFLATQPSDSRFPDDVTFGKYSLVILLAEGRLTVFGSRDYQINAVRRLFLIRYLNTGGKMIISGIQDPAAGGAIGDWLTFAPTFLHIQGSAPATVLQNNNRDFIGAKGLLGYPTIMLDSAKVPFVPDSNSLRYIAINFPISFGQSISTFDSRTNDPRFEGLPLGARFLAPAPTPPARQTYSVVYFGFPLYFGFRSSVIEGMRRAVSDVNE